MWSQYIPPPSLVGHIIAIIRDHKSCLYSRVLGSKVAAKYMLPWKEARNSRVFGSLNSFIRIGTRKEQGKIENCNRAVIMEYIDGEKSSNSFTTGVFPLSSTSEVEFEGIKIRAHLVIWLRAKGRLKRCRRKGQVISRMPGVAAEMSA